MSTPNEKCLVPTCDRPVCRRGLCEPCYQAAHRLVATKRVTWDRLEASGKALAAHAAGINATRTAWFLGENKEQKGPQ